MDVGGSEDARAIPETLDLRGLRCPLPVLRTARRLAAMSPGERVAVLCDDPLAALDLPAFCDQENQRLVSHRSEPAKGLSTFIVERGPAPPFPGSR